MNKEELRKQRQREYARKYYEEHKEELRKKKNDYRKNNLDKYKKNQKKYYQKNKDYYKNYSKEWSKQKQHELLDEIETLKQELQRKDNEIKQLQEDIVNHIKIASEYKEQMIIKNNIINELESYIENVYHGFPYTEWIHKSEALDKLKELKVKVSNNENKDL
jgi:hypothetical protein